MSKKKLFYITELLYFDEDKFKRHLAKRQSEELLKTEKEYIDIILDILINHERLFITENSLREKYILLRFDDWLLVFDEKLRISTSYKLNKSRFPKIEDLLDFMKKTKKIDKYMEVKDEKSNYKRFVKSIQKRT